MRLISFVAEGRQSWGIVEGESVLDCSGIAPTLRAALGSGRKLVAPPSARRHDLGKIIFLPPIPDPEKIICVGLNYLTHIREGGREVPRKPTIFTRWPNTQVGHLQPLVRPNVSETLDFEGEMAVIVGKSCRHVRRSDAIAVVAGFSCYNDGSVREWQRHTGQFTPGKNFPGTGGFGPWIVTPDEVGDIAKQTLLTRLNGVEMQRRPRFRRAVADRILLDLHFPRAGRRDHHRNHRRRWRLSQAAHVAETR